MFSTPESLFAVLHGVPSFTSSARLLNLELVDGLDVALRRLSVCRFIIDVSLCLDDLLIDLDVLANSFPLLQNLFLFGLDDYTGSLNSLPSLRSLDMVFEFLTSEFNIFLVPVKSAATLSRLSITSIYSFRPIGSSFNPLDILYNVTDLSLEPLDITFGTFISTTRTQLTNLTMVLSEYIDLNIIQDAFSSRCLSQLGSFTFTVPEHLLDVRYESDVLEYGIPIIDPLTSNLSSLHTLTLAMGLYLGWSHYFSQLKNLKSLTWIVREGNFNSCKEADDDDLITEEDSIVMAQREFERVFADFQEMPVFRFRFI